MNTENNKNQQTKRTTVSLDNETNGLLSDLKKEKDLSKNQVITEAIELLYKKEFSPENQDENQPGNQKQIDAIRRMWIADSKAVRNRLEQLEEMIREHVKPSIQDNRLSIDNLKKLIFDKTDQQTIEKYETIMRCDRKINRVYNNETDEIEDETPEEREQKQSLFEAALEADTTREEYQQKSDDNDDD